MEFTKEKRNVDVDTEKSQKNISAYRSHMRIREGLSFSDYGNDDKNPYEVKPPEMLRPMQEDDYPTQTKDLFKGLWESSPKDDIITSSFLCYWLDKEGNFYGTRHHRDWAKIRLKEKGMIFNADDLSDINEKMFRLGFVRVWKYREIKSINFQYGYRAGIYIGTLTHKQWSALKNAAIDLEYELHDDTKNVYIDLVKELDEEKLSNGVWYWMDKHGKLYPMESGTSAYEWAQKFLADNGIQSDEDDALEKMYALNFIRIFIAGGIINYEYGHHKPDQNRIDILVKNAKDSHYHLYDKTKHRIIHYDSTPLDENKSNKKLFIESMMPQDMDTFKSHLAQLFSYLQKELQLKTVPKIKLLSDEKNAKKVLGKTAYYDPDSRTVNLYTTDRHQKDILRSFSHEIIHHWQHENERLQMSKTGRRGESDPQYAQNNPWLRQMEKQAYLLGNILFRDWEDEKKSKDRKSGKKMVEKTRKQHVRF